MNTKTINKESNTTDLMKRVICDYEECYSYAIELAKSSNNNNEALAKKLQEWLKDLDIETHSLSQENVLVFSFLEHFFAEAMESTNWIALADYFNSVLIDDVVEREWLDSDESFNPFR